MAIAIITGGSRGLGRNMALHLAEQGTDIIFTYKSARTEADTLVAELNAQGRRAAALQLDTGRIAGFADFGVAVQTLLSEWGQDRFDYLVNNAGVGAYTVMGQTTEADVDLLVDIHFKGVVFLTQTLLPLMRDGGAIVNISSGLARFSYPGYSVYGALKAAVEALSRYWATELGPRRIRVNSIAPGAIETDFGGGAVRDNAEINAGIAAQTPLGRVGLPDDIGGAVAMLLSDKAGWINAQRIEVAGGINA